MRTHLPSPKTTFTQLPENNIYVKLWTNWSNSTCTSMFGRSDNVEGLQVLLQIYLLWLYNLSLYWSTIFMHVHFQNPYVHQLNAIWNAKAMDISTILQLLSTKIKSISQTQSKWIKSHNDKNQDDLDDNLSHTLGFHCTSQIMTQ